MGMFFRASRGAGAAAMAGLLLASGCGGGGDAPGASVIQKCIPGVLPGFSGEPGALGPALARVPGEIGWQPDGRGGHLGDGAGTIGGIAIGASLGGRVANAKVVVEFADGRRFEEWATGADGLVTLVPCDYSGVARITYEGTAGAVYYDVSKKADVAFAGQTLSAVVDIRRTMTESGSIGVTALTDAADAYLSGTLAPVRAAVAGATPKDARPAWGDAVAVSEANRRIRELINEQLPGNYRLSSDITQMPTLLDPLNADLAGTLTTAPQGLHAAVLGGLAGAGGAFLANSDAPALAIARQLSSDLADGKLDMRAGGRPVADPNDISYTFDGLHLGMAIGAGRAAKQAGDPSLKRLAGPVALWRRTQTSSGESVEFVLGSDGTLHVGIGYPGNPTRFRSFSEPPVVGILEDRALAADGRVMLEFPFFLGWPIPDPVHHALLPADSTVRMSSLHALRGGFSSSPSGTAFRMSDGRFAIRPSGSDALAELPVPDGVIAISDEGTTVSGERTLGLTSSGRLLAWKSGIPASAVDLGLSDLVSLDGDPNFAILALDASGAVYWVNADNALVPDPAGPYLGDNFGGYVAKDPAAPPQRVLGLPPVCWLRGGHAVACGSGEVWEIPEVYAANYYGRGEPIGVLALGAARRLHALAVPIWRIGSQPRSFDEIYFDNAGVVFIGVNGKVYGPDGSELTVPPTD